MRIGFTKIDKLITKAFVPPFFLTFFVVLFILFTVFISQYFEDLVGKDLGFTVYARLFFYFALTLTPQAFPLAVLLSSLMSFGSLGEHSEITAIKSSGISLVRILVPVAMYAVFICLFAFGFNNYIAPEANLRAFSLMYDIKQKKPALEFKEGGFYNDLPNYRIRIEKKSKETDEIYGVMIYDHSSHRGNTDLIIADTGRMFTIMDNNYLVMELKAGQRFSEIQSDNLYNKEFVRDKFKGAKFVFSLEALGMNQTPEELFKTHRVMMRVNELRHMADSLRQEYKMQHSKTAEMLKPYFDYAFSVDRNIAKKDTILHTDTFPANVLQIKNTPLLPYEWTTLYEKSLNKARQLHSFAKSTEERLEFYLKDSRVYGVAMYQKFTLSAACFMMFLIGAPLGTIIRKGGFGLPVLISIMFFILFYIVSLTGEKYAREGLTSMVVGAWASNIVLLLFGLFFLRQAYTDSRLFDYDVYMIWFNKIRNKFAKYKK